MRFRLRTVGALLPVILAAWLVLLVAPRPSIAAQPISTETTISRFPAGVLIPSLPPSSLDDRAELFDFDQQLNIRTALGPYGIQPGSVRVVALIIDSLETYLASNIGIERYAKEVLSEWQKIKTRPIILMVVSQKETRSAVDATNPLPSFLSDELIVATKDLDVAVQKRTVEGRTDKLETSLITIEQRINLPK
jgi:hypothetical protein